MRKLAVTLTSGFSNHDSMGAADSGLVHPRVIRLSPLCGLE
jgi:hypothetical protein